jgi:hypothetical protein
MTNGAPAFECYFVVSARRQDERNIPAQLAAARRRRTGPSCVGSALALESAIPTLQASFNRRARK